MDSQTKKYETINARCYSWSSRDEDDGKSHTVLSWCKTKENKSALVRFTKVPVMFYVELENPITSRTGLTYVDWASDVKFKAFGRALKNLKGHAPDKSYFAMRQKLYYYQGDRKYPMILCLFDTVAAADHCKKFILKAAVNVPDIGLVNCKVHESNVSPVRKLLSLMHVKFCQWYTSDKAELVPEDDRISTLEHEYIIDCSINRNSVRAVDADICKNWFVYPKILSFDIECYSPNHNMLPAAYKAGNVMYLITCIYQEYKRPETRLKFAICSTECNAVPGVNIIKVKYEQELVLEMGKLIREYDPDILIGYNIFGFDYPYIDIRIKKLMLKGGWGEISRLRGHTVKGRDLDFTGMDNSQYAEMPGRISIDLHTVIKRNYKFESYKLDFVAKEFVKRGKHDVPVKFMFETFAEWLTLRGKLYAPNVDMQDSSLQLELENFKKKITDVIAYGVEDALLVTDIFDELSTWSDLSEFSSVAGVNVMDLFTHGKQIICMSLIFDFCFNRNIVIDHRNDVIMKYVGGFVMEPITGFHKNIICLDFQSLYPSIIDKYNIDYTTLVPEWDTTTPDSDCNIINYEDEIDEEEEVDPLAIADAKKNRKKKPKKDAKKIKISIRLKFYKERRGILPDIVKDLIIERNKYKDLMGKCDKGDIMKVVYNCIQNGLKVVANSFYGFLGIMRDGKLSCLECAIAITAKGRESIQKVIGYFKKEHNADIIYGDSVTKDTPILIRENGRIKYKTIETIYCLDNEKIGLDGKQRKNINNIEVWSDKGWTKIKQIIRHKTSKKIYRILTYSGCVDVTEDHSLLSEDGTEVTPNEIKVGEKLLHTALPVISRESASELVECMNVSKNKTYDKLQTAILYWINPRQITNDLNEIKKIEYLGTTDDYVYDLETENHHFAAGIGRLVVHNTDSAMIKVDIDDSKNCNRRGRELAEEISAYMAPLKMVFEKGMHIICLKKKKYAYICIKEDGTVEYVEKSINKRGIVLARREGCKYLKKIYTDMLLSIFQFQDWRKSWNIIREAAEQLLFGEIDYKGFIGIRELGSNYKSDSFFMKVFSDELAKMGKPASPKERLEFVICDIPGETLLGKKMRLPEDFNGSDLKLDRFYYLEHLLKNPLEQLFQICHQDKEILFKSIKYKPEGRRKEISLFTPIKLIYRLALDKGNINFIKEKIDGVKINRQLTFNIVKKGTSGKLEMVRKIEPPKKEIKEKVEIKEEIEIIIDKKPRRIIEE